MEISSRDGIIRVKNKFLAHLKHLSAVDPILTTIKLHRVEETGDEKEPHVHFRIIFKDGNLKHSISDVQHYVNAICDELETDEKMKGFGDGGGSTSCSSITGEDSSYDSDYDGSEEPVPGHNDVSRTVSDTLGQEFSEYISSGSLLQTNSTYQSKLEFALKLGYTEKLVQAALQKLGPNPEQNELLAELIKLGAYQQSCSKLKTDSDSCDNVDDFPEHTTIISSDRNKLRPIVIDGSNVAMSHGNKEVFSCRGIKICVDWFRTRGHTEITVFVPKWRKETPRPDNPVMDQDILYELERERLLVFTPSREVGGKRMVCYDDRYILKLAADNDGVVVSNDNYRDLIPECPEFRKVVEERILMYSFVNDRFMPPDDPLGRSGPTLDNFLKMPSFRKGEACPYGKKCTYGNKCKYNHPERGFGPQKSVTERLVENAQKQLLARNLDSATAKKLKGKSLSLPLQQSFTSEEGSPFLGQVLSCRKQPLSRTRSSTLNCRPDANDACKSSNSCESMRSPIGCQTSPGTSGLLSSSQPSSSSSSAYYRMLYHISPGDMQPFASHNVDHDSSNANLHRKLQRQLSINPTCDPRIYQMQRQLSSPDSHPHLPASRHYSYHDQNYLSTHSNVTRISSAPPATNPPYTVTNEGTHGSSSDPQLNLSVPSCGVSVAPFNPVSSTLWSIHSHSTTPHNYVMMSQNVEETRRKLHYHLASIFPEEQVDAAMRYYPNETNPQKICAAILSMFSSKP